MKHHKLHTLLLAALLFIGAGITRGVTEEQQRKSRHFAIAAMQATINGDASASHELYKKAYALDPSNLSAGYSLALGDLSVAQEEDTTAIDKALSMMREYVDAYPADYNEGEYYAYLCSMAGHIKEAARVTGRIHALYPDRTELLPTLAGYYMQMGEYDSTLAYFNKFEELEGPSPQVSMRKILTHLMKQDTVAALAEAGSGIRTNPRSPEGYLLKGTVIRYIGFPDSTLFYLKKAEETDPSYGAAKIALAQYYEEMGDSAAFAEKVYEALLMDDLELEQKAELLSAFVEPILAAKKSTLQADSLFSVLRNQYPHEPVILDMSARYAYAKGNAGEAAEQVGFAIDLDPENSTYRLQQLTYLISDGNYASATKAYEELPEDMASDPGLLYLGAVAYTSDKRPDAALKIANDLISKLSPGAEISDTLASRNIKGLNDRQRSVLSDVYTLIGDTYYQLKELDRAYLAYDNSLLANPLNAGTLNNYAYFLSENKGDLDKALKMSAEAIALEPDNATYLDTYAWILFRRGEYKEALEYEKSALEKAGTQGESAEYYEHMGDIYFMNGSPDKALEMWRKALPLDTDNELLRRKIKNKTYFYE